MLRRQFLKDTGTVAIGSVLLSGCSSTKPAGNAAKSVGVQLYSVRKEMLADAPGTLRKLSELGYKELESARSDKGNYYGLKPAEIKKIATDLGMKLVSGHVHIDKDWQQSIDQASEAGQQYLICSSMPSEGQTIDNYQRVAEAFSKAAEDCKKSNLVFGYHNHDYEFEKVNGQILYDVLLEKSDPSLVKMEMDLGWVFVTGNDPLLYFEKYPGRFPLWHLKDMDPVKKHSVEFGKGKLKIEEILKNAGKSGMQHFFVEQEEYAVNAFQSLQEDYEYLKKLNV